MEAWSWGEDAFPPIDFAVQALIRDGMPFPPFDQHADGDGTLRAGGLSTEMWSEWVSALIDLNSSMSQFAALIGGDLPADALQRGRETSDRMMEPWSLISGSDRVRNRLHQMWDEYRTATRAWEQPLALGERGARGLSGALARSLWTDLASLHDRLPTLTVFLVEYLTPGVMPVAPTACVIAPDPDPSAYADQVRAAAGRLANAR